MRTIVEVLIQRDGLSKDAVELQLRDARMRVVDGEDPESILYTEFGLEPDYMFDLLEFN